MLTVYGAKNCHWCDKVKSLCLDNDIPYNYIDVQESDEAMTMFRDRGLRSVPQVFLSGTHIGGYAETKQYIEENYQ